MYTSNLTRMLLQLELNCDLGDSKVYGTKLSLSSVQEVYKMGSVFVCKINK